MEKSQKGYSLVELLVVLVLILIVGGIIFSLLLKVFRSFATSAGKVKQEVETSINTDFLVFDLKNIGYGISKNETKLVLEYNGTHLVMRETSNILRSNDGENPSLGFIVCKNDTEVYNGAEGLDSSNNRCVALDGQKYLLKDDIACACDSSISTDIYLLFPFWISNACKDSASDSYCCADQHCTGIVWFLDTPTDTSASSYPRACKNLNTEILYRAVTNSTGDLIKTPVINCVSDWKVWFELEDSSSHYWVDQLKKGTTVGSITINTNDDLSNYLKIAKVYILVQASYTPDPNFDVCTQSGINCNSDKCDNPDQEVYVESLNDTDGTVHNVCLKHPGGDAWRHYRWRVVEITVGNFPNIP